MASSQHGPLPAERRRHQRFRVTSDALAFLGKEPGAILDISLGGMSIRYAVFDQEPLAASSLDIFIANPSFYLPALPVQLVSEVQSLPHSLFSSLRLKRLGVKFGQLSADQQALLQSFIAGNTASDN